MAKAKSRAKIRKSPTRDSDLIVIDEKAGLIFESEKELSAYFAPAIQTLESEYLALRSASDFSDAEQLALEDQLEQTLDEADQVWLDEKTSEDFPLHIFIKDFESGFYVTVSYLSTDDEEPTFVLIHFPTKDTELLAQYQRGELVYDQVYERVLPASIEGDALVEGDHLAMGLYLAMTKVRGDKDIPEADFQNFASLREETIEYADEIWRKTDLDGNILVCFIKEFSDQDPRDLQYVAVTQEDPETAVHSLLFSFPSVDPSLVDRYRQGENLQAEEIAQENSH